MTEPQQGATYDDLLAVARTAEELGFGAFIRSDHYLGMGTDGLPGPTDAWVTLAGLARDTSTIRLGTLMTCATFRLPGPAGDRGRAGRPDERRPGGLRPRRRLVRRRAHGVRHPVPGRRASGSTGSRSSSRSSPASGRRRRARRSATTGTHYQLTDSPALPKPVQSPRPPVMHRRHGQAAYARARGEVRRRVQPAVPSPRTTPGSSSAGSARPARTPAATPTT